MFVDLGPETQLLCVHRAIANSAAALPKGLPESSEDLLEIFRYGPHK